MLPDFSFTVRNLPDVHVVALRGELDAASVIGLIDALLLVAGSTLVVDLRDLTFMDSSGIGAVVTVRNRLKADGMGDLVLTRPTAIVRMALLEVVGLSGWIVDWSPEWDE